MATKKKIPITKLVKIDPYNCSMWVTNDLEHCSKVMTKEYKLKACDLIGAGEHLKPSFAGGVSELIFDNEQGWGVFLVCFPDSPDINTIAHEAVHVKNFVCERAGIKTGLPPGQDEPEAYLVGHVTEQIYEVFNNGNKRVRRQTQTSKKET